jgi:hypothetical protein
MLFQRQESAEISVTTLAITAPGTSGGFFICSLKSCAIMISRAFLKAGIERCPLWSDLFCDSPRRNGRRGRSGSPRSSRWTIGSNLRASRSRSTSANPVGAIRTPWARSTAAHGRASATENALWKPPGGAVLTEEARDDLAYRHGTPRAQGDRRKVR